MNLKTRNIKGIIGEIANDFAFTNSEWIAGALEWIPRAISFIGTPLAFDKRIAKIEVSEYRFSMPCDLEELLMIVYNNQWLDLKQDSLLISKCVDDTILKSYTDFGVVNGNYIRTSFETGTVYVHYFGYPLDDEGYPLVIDDPEYLEAIEWFVVYRLMLKGYKHPSFKSWQEPFQMWEKTRVRAKNSLMFPDINEAERVMRTFNNLTRGNSLVNKFVLG